MPDIRRLLAEMLGAFILILGGCGAVIAATASGSTSTIVPISLAFGLALLAALYAFGEVSGGHFNPAVTLAMLLDGRVDVSTLIGYWIAQIVGGVLAGLALLVATSTDAVASTATVFGPGVEAWEAFLFEAIFTAIFLLVILKVSTSAASGPTAFLGISLTLTVIHLVLVPFTGTSVNPARSLGPGIVGGVWSDQWVYWIAPLVGAVIGWAIYKYVSADSTEGAEATA